MTLSLQHPTLGKKGLIVRGVRIAGVNHGIAQMRLTHPTLGDKKIWDGSVSSLTVNASTPYVYGAVANRGSGSVLVSTNSVTVTATTGSGPYSYTWSLRTDDTYGGTWAAASPTAATTNFSASAVARDVPSTASFRCTVTDARGATGHVDVTATVSNYTA